MAAALIDEAMARRLTRARLVQRVGRRKEPVKDGTGVDRCFAFDYMGSSEFEWGALGRSLRLMRAHLPNLVSSKLVVNIDETPEAFEAHYVGRPEELDLAAALFWHQLQQRRDHRQFSPHEYTNIERSFRPAKDSTRWQEKNTGWWVIHPTAFHREEIDPHQAEIIPFAFFKEQRDAVLWFDCVREGADRVD